MHCCDFCQRGLDPAQVTQRSLGLKEWQAEEGFSALVERLGMRQKVVQPTNGECAAALTPLSVEASSSVGNIDVLTGLPGVIAGTLIGIAIGVLVAAIAVALGFKFGPDTMARLGLGGLVGGFLGLVIGGLVYAWLIRGRAARKRLTATCRRYHLDGRRLYELSHGYSEHLQDAARVCRDRLEAGLD